MKWVVYFTCLTFACYVYAQGISSSDRVVTGRLSGVPTPCALDSARGTKQFVTELDTTLTPTCKSFGSPDSTIIGGAYSGSRFQTHALGMIGGGQIGASINDPTVGRVWKDGVISNLWGMVSNDPGASSDGWNFVLTARCSCTSAGAGCPSCPGGGIRATMSCSVNGTPDGGLPSPGGSVFEFQCNNNVDSISVVAGDRIYVVVTEVGSANGTQGSGWSAVFSPCRDAGLLCSTNSQCCSGVCTSNSCT